MAEVDVTAITAPSDWLVPDYDAGTDQTLIRNVLQADKPACSVSRLILDISLRLSGQHSHVRMQRALWSAIRARKPLTPYFRTAFISMASKPKVLLLGEIEHAHDTWKSLSSLAELTEPSARSRKEFIEECKAGKLDGVLVAYRTFASVDITGRIDKEICDALPSSLKFICHNGAGYDQVDVQACTDKGIRVSNVPTAVDDATADTNMFLILGALRGFNTSMLALRDNKWRGHPPPRLGHDPEGKTLGILGMGGIGRNLKKKAEAFGMKVIYHNRRKLDGELAGGAEYVSFDDLLAKSDVLSLNLPLNVSLPIWSTKSEDTEY